MRAFVFSASLFVAATHASAGPCALNPLAPYVKTVDGIEIPPGGGVLVSLSDLGTWSQPTQTDLTKTGWKFVDGATKTAPVIRIIAPSLAVYEPPAGSGPIKLDDATKTLVTIKRVASVPELGAPPVTGIVHTATISSPGPRSFRRSSVAVKLAGKRPEKAVALVIFTGGKTPTAASWATAFGYEGPSGEIEVYRSPDRCQPQLPGLSETPPGTRVTVAWIDASGRIGARSKEFVVAKAKP